MRIIEISAPGGPENLVITRAPIPQPATGEVLIKVRGIGVNRADILQRQGHYPPPPGALPWPGLEVSGTVEQLGSGVDKFTLGEAVMALLTGGGYAEYVSVPATQVLHVPSGVDLLAAASLPEALATSWSMIFGSADIQPAAGLRAGESILIHGGAGGVGSIAAQMAVHAGARVAVTVGSDAGAELCRSLGANLIINYKTQDFAQVIRDEWGGVDVIFDIIGAAYLESNLRALNTGGRLAIIGLQKGRVGEVNLGSMLPKRLSIVAATLRARPAAEKTEIMAQVTSFSLAIASGTIKPVVDRVFGFAEAGRAHKYMDAGGMLGKVLLDAQNDYIP